MSMAMGEGFAPSASDANWSHIQKLERRVTDLERLVADLARMAGLDDVHGPEHPTPRGPGAFVPGWYNVRNPT